MKKSLILIPCLLLSIIGCNDNGDTPPDNGKTVFDCDQLTTALLMQDSEVLQSLLDPELANFTLLDQDNDLCLHDNNLRAFVDLINDSCDNLTATKLCCGCIETLPLISEVAVDIDSAGVSLRRILDLLTPDEQGVPLTFAGIHL